MKSSTVALANAELMDNIVVDIDINLT